MKSQAEIAADELGAAICARDIDRVRAIYSDDIVVWHGSTGISQSKIENSALLDGVFQITSSLQYVEIKRHAIADGLVQQHTLVGKFDDGEELPPLHACLVILVRQGLITRIDEYFDSSIYATVWSRIGAITSAK